MSEYDEPVAALGVVVDEGRGSLPYALLHGESLIACASWALGDSGVTPVDFSASWVGIKAAGEPFVLHDVLCPMTPASFLGECLAVAVESDSVVIGFRPVTDTVKVVSGGFVGDTVDRATLRSVASPIVLPASVVAELDDLPSRDLVELAGLLAERFPVTWLEAPPEARRIANLEDLRVLEALTAR